MSDLPIVPRPHAALIAKFFSDMRMRVWMWNELQEKWVELQADTVRWDPNVIYFVGLEPPTEKPEKRCSILGYRYPKGLESKPVEGTTVYLASLDNGLAVEFKFEESNPEHQRWLELGLLHNKSVSANAQIEALEKVVFMAHKLGKESL